MAVTHIQTVELTTTASSITLSSIPGTYDDLLLVVAARSDRNSSDFYTNGKLGINGLTTGYYGIKLRSFTNGATMPDNSVTGLVDSVFSFSFPSATQVANTYGNTQFYFPNYAGSNQKAVSWDATSGDDDVLNLSGQVSVNAGLNITTSPITSIEVGIRAGDSANFVAGSVVSLYGITQA